jgi:hypothetical protein
MPKYFCSTPDYSYLGVTKVAEVLHAILNKKFTNDNYFNAEIYCVKSQKYQITQRK